MKRYARWLTSASIMAKLNAALTILWLLLIIPSVLWWSESVPWLVIMSAWANLAGHWASYQSAHSEVENDAQMEDALDRLDRIERILREA